jgi:hypothetical protein
MGLDERLAYWWGFFLCIIGVWFCTVTKYDFMQQNL